MWLSSMASQIEVPADALMLMPSGQYSECGRILMMGIQIQIIVKRVGVAAPSDRVEIFSSKCLGNAPIHSGGCKGLGRISKGFGLRFDVGGVVAVLNAL